MEIDEAFSVKLERLTLAAIKKIKEDLKREEGADEVTLCLDAFSRLTIADIVMIKAKAEMIREVRARERGENGMGGAVELKSLTVNLKSLTPEDIKKIKEDLGGEGAVATAGNPIVKLDKTCSVVLTSLTPEEIQDALRGNRAGKRVGREGVGLGVAVSTPPPPILQPKRKVVVSPGKKWYLIVKEHNQWARQNGHPIHNLWADKKPKVDTLTQGYSFRPRRLKRLGKRQPERMTRAPALERDESGSRSSDSDDSLFIRDTTPKKSRRSTMKKVKMSSPVKEKSPSPPPTSDSDSSDSLFIKLSPAEVRRLRRRQMKAEKEKENLGNEEAATSNEPVESVVAPNKKTIEEPRVNEVMTVVVPLQSSSSGDSSSSATVDDGEVPGPSSASWSPPNTSFQPRESPEDEIIFDGAGGGPFSEPWMEEIFLTPQFQAILEASRNDDFLPDLSLLEDDGPDLAELMAEYERDPRESRTTTNAAGATTSDVPDLNLGDLVDEIGLYED